MNCCCCHFFTRQKFMAQKQLQTLNYKLRWHVTYGSSTTPRNRCHSTTKARHPSSNTFRLCPGLTSIWPYGRVYQTDTGFHGEFFEPNEMILSLIYLGNDDLDAMYMMKRIMNNNSTSCHSRIFIDYMLKEACFYN